MGKPGWSHVQSGPSEHIGRAQGTRGTETSQYPEEEKANARPLVVVSERGSSLNRPRVKPTGVAWSGLWDVQEELLILQGVTKCTCRGMGWKAQPQTVTARYSKHDAPPGPIPSSAGPEKSRANLRGPPRKAEYYSMTDSGPVP